MNKIISFILVFLISFNTIAVTCDPAIEKQIISLGVSLNNVETVYKCCGTEEKPGPYLADRKKTLSYKACVSHFKQGVPEDIEYSADFGGFECIGALLVQAWESLKRNYSELIETATHPLETAAEIAEFGKILLTEEGRSKIYNLIAQSIQDEAREFYSCLTNEERAEETCKAAGAFVANFVPPYLVIKKLISGVKYGHQVLKLRKEKKAQEIKLTLAAEEAKKLGELERRMGPAFKGLSDAKKAALLKVNDPAGFKERSLKDLQQRVKALDEAGLTEDEIVKGLDPKYYLFTTEIKKAKFLESIAPLENPKLAKAKVTFQLESTSGDLNFPGENNLGIEILEVDGKKVFAKSVAEENDPLYHLKSFGHEAEMAKELSDLGVGPKFFGVFQGSDKKYRIATEYVDGYAVHFGFTDQLKASASYYDNLDPRVIKDMREKTLKVIDAGINPGDIQFRVDAKTHKAFLIDPSFFQKLSPEKAKEVRERMEKFYDDLLKTNKEGKPLERIQLEVKPTAEIIERNSKLTDINRIKEFEKLTGKNPGSLTKEKRTALINAHYQEGVVNELNFGQIRDRVKILRAADFTDEEIRTGMDYGIFGSASTNISKINLDQAIQNYMNPDLNNSTVILRLDTLRTKGDYRGANNLGIEIMDVNGEKVFSKAAYRERKDITAGQMAYEQSYFLNEVEYVKKLSELNMGPSFKGVYKGADGKYRIVTQFVDGFEVHLGEIPSKIKNLHPATITEMNRMAMKLIDQGIDPLDLQFRVDARTGKPYIIDPSYFSPLDPADKPKILKDLEKDFKQLLEAKRESLQKLPAH